MVDRRREDAVDEAAARFAQTLPPRAPRRPRGRASHPTDGRAASEQLADQARRQQEAGQAFAQESVKAYMDFLDTAFSQYREGTQRAAGSAQEGTRAGSQAATDVVGIAADTTRANAQSAAGQPPIDGYDEMNVEELTSRLDGLSEAELRRVRNYEQGNKNRSTLIEAIDSRLTGSA